MNNQSPSSIASPALNTNMMMMKPIPEHIADPFDLHESITVGITTAALFTYIHFAIHEKLYGDNRTQENGSKTKTQQLQQKTRDPEFGARIISFLHAFISAIGSAYALYIHMTDGVSWFDTRPATRLEANWQMFSFSYFACDTIIMIFSKFDKTFFIHHMISMASLGCGSIFGIYGPIVASAQLAGELSNPFMHLRWLLNSDDKRDTMLCRFCTRMWFLTFFVARLIVCPYLAYYAVQVMHPVFWPQVWLMIIFSGKFMWDALQSERKGEWWIG